MGVEILVPMGFFATVVTLALGIPLVRAYNKRLDTQASRPSLAPEVMTRLERMEQSIDSIAVEIERISEGQRFTTKLLSSGRQADAVTVAGAHQPVSGPRPG